MPPPAPILSSQATAYNQVNYTINQLEQQFGAQLANPSPRHKQLALCVDKAQQSGGGANMPVSSTPQQRTQQQAQEKA